MTEKVEMRGVYEWTCPECGIDQLERPIRIESPDKLAEIASDEEVNLDEYDQVNLMPGCVTCRECGATFETEYPGNE